MQYKVLGSTGYAVDLPKIISLDTEYSELNIRKADLLSISIGVSTKLTYILDEFKQAQRFIDEADIIYFWNYTVDVYMLAKNGITVPFEKIRDAMLMEHLVDERVGHSLGEYALRNFEDNYKSDFWDNYDKYQDAPKEVAYEYEMRDGCYTYHAGEIYSKALESRWPLVEHTHKLARALFDTEVMGIKVNRSLIEKTKLDMGEKITSYLGKLREEYNDYCNLWEMQEWKKQLDKRKTEKGKLRVSRPTFSFTSDKQIQWLVYDALECPITEKTKKGKGKTDYDTLIRISEENPALAALVEYKDIKAVYSTFVVGMLERVEEDSRIYPTFHISGTVTGRISHAAPNMGNIPTAGVIRNFFIPDDGFSIVGADYSQLEVVVEANLTEDKNTLKILLEGASKHDITAQGLGISRDQAKTLNFALGYGAGANKVSKILGVSFKEAENVLAKYWEIYSGVWKLKEETFKELETNGFVTNIFGRERHFERPKNEYEKARQERQAYNFKVQGPGGDMTNMSTYRVYSRLQREQLGRLWFSVHDEIIAEVKSDLAEQAKAAIVEEMEGVNDYVKFKYRVGAKSYGALPFWSKC